MTRLRTGAITLVGTMILAISSPAAADELFRLVFGNNTASASSTDEGSRLRVSIYRYKDGERKKLLAQKTVEPGKTRKHEERINCGNTTRREFVIETLAADGSVSRMIAGGVAKWKVDAVCLGTAIEFERIGEDLNDAFVIRKRKDGGFSTLVVRVDCEVAGKCED
jgi:hypothetical protein